MKAISLFNKLHNVIHLLLVAIILLSTPVHSSPLNEMDLSEFIKLKNQYQNESDTRQNQTSSTITYYDSNPTSLLTDENPSEKQLQINSTNLSDIETYYQTLPATVKKVEPLHDMPVTPSHQLRVSQNQSIQLPTITQFGYDVFKMRKTNTIDLSKMAPPNTYILGPGDKLLIKMWGAIEMQSNPTLDANGEVFLSKIGNVRLQGLTVKKAEELLTNEYQKKFINFNLSLTLAELKMIKVFILGDVTFPGAYDISSLSTLFTALFHANGPTKKGSLRHIQLIRDDTVIHTLDLYAYLLNGNKDQDKRLQNLDTIFVPPIGDVVKVDGAVKRKHIFEIKHHETAHTILTTLAGGFSVGASPHHVAIYQSNHTVPELKSIHAKSLQQLLKKLSTISLQNGDAITVHSKTPDYKNTVEVEGEVVYPGVYSHRDGLTLSDLINMVGGAHPEAFLDEIQITRTFDHDKKQVFFINLNESPQFKLHAHDKITISNFSTLFGKKYVYIEGEVVTSGKYELFQDMTVHDLIRLAKPTPEATFENIELFRKHGNSGDHSESIVRIDLESTPSLKMPLYPNDRISIKTNRELTLLKRVTLKGEFNKPGIYIAKQGESLSSIFERAGGFTSDAFLEGAIFTRKNTKDNEVSGYQRILEEEKKRLVLDQRTNHLIKTDFTQVFSTVAMFLDEKIEKSKGRAVIYLTPLPTFKGSPHDIPVEDGDVIEIPEIPETVQIMGGIQQPTALMYKPEKNHKYYIKLAGNYSDFAKKSQFYVIKPNGTIAMNSKQINRGDTIYIPENPKIYVDWLDILAKITGIVSSSLAAAALAISLSN
jgi:protein involved in polysaccharide export with SLBB domain